MALLMTMEKQSDEELLELAAKAVGFDLEYNKDLNIYYYNDPSSGLDEWYPFSDRAQCMFLLVKLSINVAFDKENNTVTAWHDLHSDFTNAVPIGDYPFVSTMYAVVLAAAEIGRRMQDEQSTAARG